MALSRNQRRVAARKNHGTSLGQFRRDRAENERQKREALTLTPAQARQKLGEWARAPGRTQKEIDDLNLTPEQQEELLGGKG